MWLVDAAIGISRDFGVSELVIGLTVVAAGTSMPEVATSIMAAIRGERDIAVGNLIGSSIFNILGCLGLSGLVTPDGLAIAQAVLNFDLWVMLINALAAYSMHNWQGNHGQRCIIHRSRVQWNQTVTGVDGFLNDTERAAQAFVVFGGAGSFSTTAP